MALIGSVYRPLEVGPRGLPVLPQASPGVTSSAATPFAGTSSTQRSTGRFREAGRFLRIATAGA